MTEAITLIVTAWIAGLLVGLAVRLVLSGGGR